MTEQPTAPTEINIYCDESCHFERDEHSSMVLGALWCPKDKSEAIAKRISSIKTLHGIKPHNEVKWSKISPKLVKLYLALVNYFFSESDLHFRALVIPDKSKLRHEKFNRSHDDWYYIMYFDMLKVILSRDECYHIYIDIKDTRGAKKVRELWEKLEEREAKYDFNRQIVQKMQLVKSHEIQQMQLADLLIGCVSFANRGRLTAEGSSEAKRQVVRRVQAMANYDLTKSTLLRERKFNLFSWQAQDVHD